MKWTEIDKPEKLFLVLALVFGAACMLITPPFQVPDEYGHFYRAYQVSEGGFRPQRQGAAAGGYLPESLMAVSMTVSKGITFHAENKQNLNNLVNALGIPLQSRRVFVQFPYIAQYSPVPYAASAAAMAAGRAAGLGPLYLMYLGRAANLCVWITLMYLSIGITPVLKWLFTLLALTPMSVFEAASLSADSFTNASAFLFIALVFRYALDEDRFFGEDDVMLLGASAIALSLSKSIYALILPLFFIIPPGKFQPGGVRRAAALSMFISCAALIFIWTSNTAGFAALESTKMNVHPALQLKFITTHPLAYAVIFAKTLAICATSLPNQFIGALGWLDVEIPLTIRMTYLAALFAAALIESNGAMSFKRGQKSIMLLIILSVTAAIFTSQYVTWSSYMNDIIEGPQGRHFIPPAPLIFSLFHVGEWVRNPIVGVRNPIVGVRNPIVGVLNPMRGNFINISGKPFTRFVGIYLSACWVWTILVLVERYYAV
jgi:uncharacterized membrane protein